MSSPSNVIDLPVSPLRSTVAEGSLLNAPVTATLMSGRTITGRLVALDGPQAVLTLHSSEKGRSIIKFTDLRMLNFISKYPTNTAKHPLQEGHAGDVSMPRAVEDFHVVFSDGRFLSGRTRGSFVDNIGLHLFQLVGSAFISRIFIPSQVVRKYNIGDRKPATVHQHTAASSHKAAAEEKKPALKRRKTDRKTQGLALNSMQLEQALEQQPVQAGDHLLGSKQIGRMLVEDNIITPEQLEAALQMQQQDRAQKLGEILVKMGTVSAHDIYRALAHKFGLPFVLLRNFYIDLECLSLVPADVAHKYALVPLVIYQNRLVVAMDDPANTEAITLLRFITRYTIEPTIATKDDINWAIGKYYGSPAGGPAQPASGQSAGTVEAPRPAAHPEHGAADHDKPIVSFVDNTLLDAIQRNAADILMVPKRDYIELQVRIDGALIPIRRFSKVLYPKVVDRLKTMGGMNMREDRAGQHGRASIVSDGRIFDLRIALTPGDDGMLALIHLLNTSTRLRLIKDLGMSAREEDVFMEELSKTYSMVLVTGPEGSDKSTTLYAALLALKAQELRILTLEDPVAYHLGGIDQVQLDRGAGASLPGLVKHMDLKNTDVVLFGDIRDAETAECAIRTALGKHLVLGRMHAGNTVEAVMKLTQMGIDARRLKASLPCVIAQRALRLNCSHCTEVESVPPERRQALGIGADEVFYRGTGCPRCNHTGVQGRTIVYELLEMTPDIYSLLENGASATEIRQQALKNGMVPLMENALLQARARAVSFAEVYQNF